MSREFLTLTPLFSVRLKNLWMYETYKNNCFKDIYIKFLNFVCILQNNKCTCQKSEAWFFSLMCQEAIAILIDFFHFFLADLDLNVQKHILLQKARQFWDALVI